MGAVFVCSEQTPSRSGFPNGATPIPTRNPLTGKVYADGILSTSDFSPLATLAFAALQAESAPAGAGVAAESNYVSLPRATINDKKGDGRFDYTPSSKLVLFGRYSQHCADRTSAR